jgi:PAT family beta-lactamase induction signal transducer AmpG
MIEPPMRSRTFRYGLLFVLGMTEVMPPALVVTALPAVLRRNGASLEELGLLSLAMIPWGLKALWAPLVDRVGARSRLGRYRGWLLVSYLALSGLLVAGAAVDVAALLATNPGAGIAALLLLSTVAGTADVASHGLAVTMLAPDERAAGNAVQSIGMTLGMLVGGGLMVMFIDGFGWRTSLLVMAATLVVPLVGVLLHREAPVDPTQTVSLRAVLAFFRRPRIGRWLLIAGSLVLLPALVIVPFQAQFVDHGMSLAEIGLVLGVVHNGAGAVGGAAAGVGVARLGRARAFYGLHLLLVVCMSLAGLAVLQPAPGRLLLYAAVAVLAFGYATSSTSLRVLMMDRSRPHLAGTDFTIQVSFVSLFAYLGAGLGGYLAGYVGTAALFIGAAALLLAALHGFTYVLGSADFSPTQDG